MGKGLKGKVKAKASQPREDWDEAEWQAGLGSHYDKVDKLDPKKSKKRKTASRDLFNDEAGGWGMMMGGIEVIDATMFTTTGAVPDATPDEEGQGHDASDNDGFSDCDISDEECDITIKDPSDLAQTAQAQAPAPVEPVPKTVLNPRDHLESKRIALKTINSYLSSHQPTQKTITSWQTHCSGLTLPPLLSHSFSALKYSTPLPIQSAVLPAAILGCRDIVGCAPTGSGKTLCYATPIMHSLLLRPPTSPALQALILTPTRELAIQVANEMQSYVKIPAATKVGVGAVVRIGVLVGGLAETKQSRVLRSRPEVIVATPGRLWEMVSKNCAPA